MQVMWSWDSVSSPLASPHQHRCSFSVTRAYTRYDFGPKCRVLAFFSPSSQSASHPVNSCTSTRQGCCQKHSKLFQGHSWRISFLWGSNKGKEGSRHPTRLWWVLWDSRAVRKGMQDPPPTLGCGSEVLLLFHWASKTSTENKHLTSMLLRYCMSSWPTMGLL